MLILYPTNVMLAKSILLQNRLKQLSERLQRRGERQSRTRGRNLERKVQRKHRVPGDEKCNNPRFKNCPRLGGQMH